MAPKWHMFIDESGQREFGPSTDRYFVCAGTIVRIDEANVLEVEMSGLKRAFFRDPDVEIKSNWIRQPKEASKHYYKPYGIGPKRLNNFVVALHRWINSADITFVAGVVDKVQCEKQYAKPFYASALAYQIVLQRYQKFLATRQAVGRVTMDKLTGATQSKKKWKDLLAEQHRKLKEYGCNLTRMTFDNVDRRLRFVESETSSLIQISDLCAYNVFRQFRDHGSIWDDPDALELPLYNYLRQMLPNFRTVAGVFAGYGIAKIPRLASNRWLA